MNRFFTLLFAASCLTAVGQDFDGLTQAFTTDSSLFLTSEGYLSWDSAQAFAASIGGHLATFASTTENLEVVPSVNSNVGTGGYWFGLRQDINGAGPNEGWGWATGESLTFTNWGGSEPNNVNGIEDCGELNLNGTWNDADCEVLRRFVVEVTLHAGCADQQACNFDSQANFDDGSCVGCEVLASACGVGTVWDAETQTCIVANPSDSNFDGCVQLNDLLDLLSAYGTCSSWQCGDPLEYQGYDYETVQIGEQCWFAENLRNEHYANGDAIPGELSNIAWANTNSGAQAIYDNDVSNLADYGRLYNWYAVDNSNGLCSTGWHVPTDEDWQQLELFLGMPTVELSATAWRGSAQNIGGQLKASSGWSNNGNGTDDVSFSAKQSGARDLDGSYVYANTHGYWWSASAMNNKAWRRSLWYSSGGIYRDFLDREAGQSVRCIKD